jgi:hypothetical protein
MVIFHIDKIKIGFEFILIEMIDMYTIDLQSNQEVGMKQEDLETVGE